MSPSEEEGTSHLGGPPLETPALAEARLRAGFGKRGAGLCVDSASPLLFLPFEEVKQDRKSQRAPVGLGSKEPAVSAVTG